MYVTMCKWLLMSPAYIQKDRHFDKTSQALWHVSARLLSVLWAQCFSVLIWFGIVKKKKIPFTDEFPSAGACLTFVSGQPFNDELPLSYLIQCLCLYRHQWKKKLFEFFFFFFYRLPTDFPLFLALALHIFNFPPRGTAGNRKNVLLILVRNEPGES